MNCNAFLKPSLAAGALFTATFTAIAERRRKRIGKGIRVTAGKDRFDKPISLLEGDKATYLATGVNLFIFLLEPLGRSENVQLFLKEIIKG